MNKNDVIIRLEKEEDYRETENLVRNSFWNVYTPGCYEHFVLKNQRTFPDFVKELDFVMFKDGEMIGQNVFVKTVINSDNGGQIPVLAMGPICIAPEYKRQGYGKYLLDYSLEMASNMGFGAVCLEGNIDFYGKSGFACASGKGIRYHGVPEGEDTPFFLCKELKEGYLDNASGEYVVSECFFVCQKHPEEFEAYESTFPKKEKLKLPGQIF